MANYETCKNVIYSNFADQRAVETAVKELQKLPEKMVKEFADNDWHIYISKNSIETHIGERKPKDFTEPHICGITFWEARIIIIPINNTKYVSSKYNDIILSLVHEFGHYLDRSKGYQSQSYTFQNIYDSEGQRFCEVLCTASNTSDSFEYFAEAFAEYVRCKERLEEVVPRTYNYLKKIFSEYEEG